MLGNRAVRDGTVERHLVGGCMGAVTARKASAVWKVVCDCGYFGALGLDSSVETAKTIERKLISGVFGGRSGSCDDV